MKRAFQWIGTVSILWLAVHVSLAQRWRNSNGGEGWVPGIERVRTAREVPLRSVETPAWTNLTGFAQDVFTFARVRYTRLSRSESVWWNGGYWYSDFPDSDLNLSYRVQQITSIRTDSNGRVVDLTDPDLFHFPWIYMVEPALMVLEEDEIPVLHRYLVNGGFLMADDFWGEPQWLNFEREMKRVFPEREFVELSMDHPIFHCVYDLAGPKNSLQVPNVLTGREAGSTGITWEVKGREVCKDVHFKAILDDKNRLMVLACHNTDYGDGWERESEDDYFFHRFSEKIAYPLAINILFYVMTH